MIRESVTVLRNESMGHSYYRMGLACADHYRMARPGQFVMVHLAGPGVPLLARPFSIHRPIVEAGKLTGIEVLYKVVGKCTERMARLTTGDRLDLLGPLGRGFRISGDDSRIFLVSGGIGVAPMVFLAAALSKGKAGPAGCTVFLGGRTGDDVLCREIFTTLGMETVISTDDGSAGEHAW